MLQPITNEFWQLNPLPWRTESIKGANVLLAANGGVVLSDNSREGDPAAFAMICEAINNHHLIRLYAAALAEIIMLLRPISREDRTPGDVFDRAINALDAAQSALPPSHLALWLEQLQQLAKADGAISELAREIDELRKQLQTHTERIDIHRL